MLFVELALIRWAGENIVYVSFFSNFVLLGSFLGIGLGFLWAGRRGRIHQWSLVAFAILVGLMVLLPVSVDRTGSDLIYFGGFGPRGLPPWIMLPALFLAVAAVLAMIADGVARAFAEFEPLTAYRLDIFGSVLGSIAFALLAWLETPPIVWGVAAAFTLFMLSDRRVVDLAGGIALIAAVLWASSGGAVWSPYYRVDAFQAEGSIAVNVNGIPHQNITTVEARLAAEPFYAEPYAQFANGVPDDVLIIGAGNGTDVAIALDQGVSHITAVEIDPVLQRLGVDLHPDQPYADPRVAVVIDDGRAYMQQTDATFDLVLYALPDSLTLVSGQSALRLESYLFTEESLERVTELVNPGGVFAMYNYYREEWLVARLAGMLESAFGTEPCVIQVGGTAGLAVLTVSATEGAVNCPAEAVAPDIQVSGVTDDRPFLYLRDRTVPPIYAWAVVLILVTAFVAVRFVGGGLGGVTNYFDLFLMGAAFLLLETKTIVQFSLLFGATWLVNAFVFIGILVSVLAAIEVARLRRTPGPNFWYGLLAVSLVVALVVPLSSLLNLPFGLRLLAGLAVAFSPVFIANVIFAQRFRDTASSTDAFGANLLGAMVGGVLEYASVVVGFRALTVLVAAFYLGAFVISRRSTGMAVGPAPGT